MFSSKKHYTAQSTQESDKLNRYTFLEKSSAQLDEHHKKTRIVYDLPITSERKGIFCLRFNNDGTKLLTSFGNGVVEVISH